MTPKYTAERVKEIFVEALEQPDAERSAFLDRACGGDDALRAEVEAFLADEKQASRFLSQPGMRGDNVTLDAQPPERLFEGPGSIIGRYKLLQQIGEGGFGVVFMAEQENPVRRTVALKVIKLGMDTLEVVARFEAERQALAMMDHPNIAKVLDAGSTATGRPYFVMELVRGSPLTEYCDKRKLATSERVALLAQVCRAVQHAHSKGIIHRDLKPGNVLVTVADDKPIPKVIDFGIAKATQSRLTDRTLFTAFRQMIGTPQYMSPEQADSDGVDVDTRTDVYSLGVMLYELLVGTTPFDARSLRSAALEEMRRIIRDVEPPRPSTRLQTMAGETMTAVAAARSSDTKKLSQSVRGELDWIVMKALEKDRARRYDTAAALADDLNRYLAGDAVMAGPVSGAYRLKKILKRYKAAAFIGGAIAACLLLGVAGTTFGLVQARHERGIAVINEHRALAGEANAQQEKADALAQKRTAEEKTQEARATLDFLTTDVLAKASPKNTRDAKISQVLVDVLIKPALSTVGRRFAGQPAIQASIRQTLAALLVELGRAELAEPPAKAAWDACRQVLGDDQPQTLSALSTYANVVQAQGRVSQAMQLFKQCWDARRRVLGDNHADTLTALQNYASALYSKGRYVEAEKFDKQCWDARRREVGDDDPNTLASLNNYANAVLAQGRYAEAERLSKQGWDADRRVLGENHPATIDILNNYAVAIYSQGRPVDAEPLFKLSWDLCRQVLGDDHPGTLAALSNYAGVIDDQGRRAEAEGLYKRCWDARKRVSGEDHPDTLNALQNYAYCVEGQGRHAEAEQLDKQCWDARRRVSGADHPDTLQALQDYASTILAQGRFADAEKLFKQCLDTEQRVLGESHPSTLMALNNYANAVEKQGRYPEAAGLFKQCWEARRTISGEGDSFTLTALHNYANAVKEQGDNAAGIPLYRQLIDTLRRFYPHDPVPGDALLALGQCLVAQHQWREAEPVLRESLIWSRANLPAAVPESLQLLNQCLKAQGKPVEATTGPTTVPATSPTGR